jgi:hypothetical protein
MGNKQDTALLWEPSTSPKCPRHTKASNVATQPPKSTWSARQQHSESFCILRQHFAPDRTQVEGTRLDRSVTSHREDLLDGGQMMPALATLIGPPLPCPPGRGNPRIPPPIPQASSSAPQTFTSARLFSSLTGYLLTFCPYTMTSPYG